MGHPDPQVQSTATASPDSELTAFEREQIRVHRLGAWLTAGEIVMASRNGWEAQSKAQALAAFFPSEVPDSFADRFDPAKHSWGRVSHTELLELLMAQPTSPGRRALVLKTWKDVFPDDSTWVNEIPAN
jgi:hypothetical protein